MSIKNLKALKSVTKIGAPVKRTVEWVVDVGEANIESLKTLTGNTELQVGESTGVEGEVFIKKLNFKDSTEVSKAFDWDYDKDDIKNSVLKSVDGNHLTASRLLGSICGDVEGTPFFDSPQEVYSSEPAFINALYDLADEVNNFQGKSRKKNSTKMNSGVSLSSTVLVEEPLPKQKTE